MSGAGRRPSGWRGARWRTRLRRLLLFAAVPSLALAVAAIAQPPSGIVHPEQERGTSRLDLGAELFAGNCSSCHGSQGQGIPTPRTATGGGGITGQGPDLRGVGAIAPDFYLRTGRMPLSSPDETPERHPPFFSDREIRALTSYIASLGKGPPIPEPRPRRQSLARGLHLYTEHCAGCHQVVGEGGYVTDTKVPVLQHANAREIAEAVRIGPYLMPRFSRKAISDNDLDAIIAYVLHSHDPDDAGGLGLGHIGPVPEGMVAWAVAGFVLVGVCAAIGSRLSRP
jgi:ubiquinol-cytochrome c reductase cytochrome c subunit